jgi:hypothetical protein
MVAIIEVISSPIFLAVYALAMVSVLLLVFSFKYALFGSKAFFKKMSGRYGLMFLKMPGGNIKFPPHFVDMEKTEAKIKSKGVTKRFPYNRTDFDDTRLFGFPFVIKDHDDAIRTYGLYSIDVDTDYKPKFHVFTEGDKTYQTNIPILTQAKSANVVDPELIDGMISKAGVLDSLKELFDRNKTLFYVIIASIAISGISLYVAYESYTMLQTLGPAVESIKATLATSGGSAIVPAP